MFKKKKLEEKKPYQKINWYEDKYQTVLVWRNWLYVITVLSLIGITAVCGILFFMLPLKSVAPFVIQVDEKSGLSEVVTAKSIKEYRANEKLIQYFAMNYITSRESYDINSFEMNKEVIRLMSAKDVYRYYFLQTSPENIESPLKRFADHTNRYVDMISFSIIRINDESGEADAQARLRVRELSINSTPIEYIIVVNLVCSFEEDLNLTEKQRLINPLGFVVKAYKVDKEVSEVIK